MKDRSDPTCPDLSTSLLTVPLFPQSVLTLCACVRAQVRDSLEEAIAEYEATNVRPKVYIQTGKVCVCVCWRLGETGRDDFKTILRLLAD